MRYAIVGLVLWGLVAAAPARPAHGQITPEAVSESINRGVAYLKRLQRADGSWPEYASQPGGLNSLCTLALLNAGVQPDEEPIQRALTYLRRIPPQMTYSVSLQTMVFCRAQPEKNLLNINGNVKWLEQAQIRRDRGKGGWSYDVRGGPMGDNSNTQFALLALHEADRLGIPVSAQTWRLAKLHWEEWQNANGSWGYRYGQPGTGSMTCAGICSLVITADRVYGADAQVDGDRITCCQSSEADDSRIQRALKWLGDNFAVSHNPQDAGMPLESGLLWHMYYLYGLERVGRMTARRFIGEHDWYREGADFLVKMKGGPLSDHWRGRGPIEGSMGIGGDGVGELVSTSFALLFLSKGRWPILVSKVKHGRGSDWNQHRSDVANLARYVESKWKMDLVWQVVDIHAASVDDLLQAPVLYYCGANTPLPDTPEAQEELARKLRDYLDRSGFLFAEAYCGGAAFNEGFRKLVEKIFPEPEYRLKLLPPEHPIWRAEELIDTKQLRPLYGIEFGCRTSVVYSPPSAGKQVRAPLSCLWELSRGGRETQYSPSVRAEIGGGMAIGINVLSYATNRGQLQPKPLNVPTTPDGKRADGLERGRLQIASLRHPGGCTAAPRALATL
jgi:hypothetical protein